MYIVSAMFTSSTTECYAVRWTVVGQSSPTIVLTLTISHINMHTHMHTHFQPQTSASVSEYNLLSLIHTLTTGEKYTGRPSSRRGRGECVIEELLDKEEEVSGEQKVLPLIYQRS